MFVAFNSERGMPIFIFHSWLYINKSDSHDIIQLELVMYNYKFIIVK